jgi:hypothetical protein
MLSWLFALCLLLIALCRAAPPPMVVVVKAAIGVVTYPVVPTLRAEGNGLREDAGLPEDPDQHGHAHVVGCAGRSGLRVGDGWRDAGGLDGCSG